MCDDNRTAAAITTTTTTATNLKSTTNTATSDQLGFRALANTKFHTTACSKPYSLLAAAAALQDAAAQPANLVALPNPALNTHKMLLTQRRRRFLQRHACLLSIVAAFVIGLVLGVLAPLMDVKQFLEQPTPLQSEAAKVMHLPLKQLTRQQEAQVAKHNQSQPQVATRPPSDFPTIYDGLQAAKAAKKAQPYAVAFVQEQPPQELSAEEVFRNAFHLEQLKQKPGLMLVKKLDTEDGSIKEFQVERLGKGRFLKGPEKRLSKPTLTESMLVSGSASLSAKTTQTLSIVPLAQRILANSQADKQQHSIIKDDIFWGDVVEQALPKGFNERDAKAWQHYVSNAGQVTQFEPGCGRMQNRLIVFSDGTKACARYRQNTDQIQGEIFSYYLGQLLNISNLAPSAATVVDLNSHTWASALADITQAQWKQQRPVVLTRWLPDLEPAGIPQPFQPLERHLNKYDVWNISLSNNNNNNENKHKKAAFEAETTNKATLSNSSSGPRQHNQSASGNDVVPTSATVTTTTPTPAVLQRLVELAQWSDLIVFDYLIANLDRVVNNLYNFQWNADIMAAPAHNLARQTATQLLVFLDNESGLLHGYRLLKKYEAYHGVLLDNLCVFRQPTIVALRQLRNNGAGRMLRALFERSTNSQVRDVLPTLPDKSIKILVDRIDRVLGQVQKCKDLLSDS